MSIIERIQAAYTALTARTFVMFSRYDDEVGYCHYVGDHDEVMNLLQGGNQYLMENGNE